jgi:hypothetical protein
MDVGRLAVVVQTSWSHNLDGWRLSSYHPSQRNVTGPICRFSRNAAVLGQRTFAAVCSLPFSVKREFAVFGQTQVCRFQSNASLPFSAKRKFAVFGQTQVCRFRPNASLPFTAKLKFAVFGPTAVSRFAANTSFGQCHILAKRLCVRVPWLWWGGSTAQ